MIIVNKHEKEQINNGEKWATLRPIRASGKGYLRLGSLQMFCEGRDFKNGFFNRGLIYSRSFCSVESLTSADCQALGYSSKAEYMAQNYNVRNSDPLRVRYDFITLPDLLALVESAEITPANFEDFKESFKLGVNNELLKGIDCEAIYEGCDCEYLAEAFAILESNIREAIL